jgi:hypothetical protein
MNEIGELAVEDTLQGIAEGRMIAADGKHAKSAQQIQIARAIPVIQIRTLAAAKADVISDGLEHPHHLFVQMAREHREPIALALVE